MNLWRIIAALAYLIDTKYDKKKNILVNGYLSQVVELTP